MSTPIASWLGVVIVLSCFSGSRADISCRNEAGEPVDWFIIYKMPKYKIGEEVGSGVDYLYLDPSLGGWQRSSFMVNSSQGALGSTLNQIYKEHGYKSNSSVYAFYNDGPPDMEYLREYGHTKGVLLCDHVQGFWLSHSVPGFPAFPERGYLYPSSGKVNGQTALCVTYKYAQFSMIAQQLVYLNPRVYNCSVPDSFLTDLAPLAQLCKASTPPPPPLPFSKRATHLLSAQGETFVSFAKSAHFVDDIYAGWVAQALGSDLLVQSWQMKSHSLPSNCTLPKHVLNVGRLHLPGPSLFWSRHDHSKWCVSQRTAGAEDQQWACLGDLNRERAQAWRAGGLLCSRHPVIYKAFRQAVDWYMDC